MEGIEVCMGNVGSPRLADTTATGPKMDLFMFRFVLESCKAEDPLLEFVGDA